MTQTTPRSASRAALRTHALCILMVAAPLAVADAPLPTNGPLTPAPTPPADTSPEHTSYLFGLTFGEQMHAVGISKQVNPDDIAQGIKDGLQGKKSTRADQQQIQQFVQSVLAAAANENKAAAKEFLAHNGTEKNVKTTASGLQYKVLVPGSPKAELVRASDEVTVNYRGKLLDGTEFDSSYSRGTPATFKVDGVIKGWQEALVLMKPGAKWELFVPPELAYGDSPRPGIPAGSLLIFDVDMMSVTPTPPAGATAPGTATPRLPPSHKAVPPLNPTPNQ